MKKQRTLGVDEVSTSDSTPQRFFGPFSKRLDPPLGEDDDDSDDDNDNDVDDGGGGGGGGRRRKQRRCRCIPLAVGPDRRREIDTAHRARLADG